MKKLLSAIIAFILVITPFYALSITATANTPTELGYYDTGENNWNPSYTLDLAAQKNFYLSFRMKSIYLKGTPDGWNGPAISIRGSTEAVIRNGHIGCMTNGGYNVYWTNDAQNFNDKWLDYKIIVYNSKVCISVTGDGLTDGGYFYDLIIDDDTATQIRFSGSDTRMLIDDIRVRNVLTAGLNGADAEHNWRSWAESSELGDNYSIDMIAKMTYPEGAESWNGVSVALGSNTANEGLSVDLRKNFTGVNLNNSLQSYDYSKGFDTTVWTPVNITLNDNKLTADIGEWSYSLQNDAIKPANLTRNDIEMVAMNCYFSAAAFVASPIEPDIYSDNFDIPPVEPVNYYDSGSGNWNPSYTVDLPAQKNFCLTFKMKFDYLKDTPDGWNGPSIQIRENTSAVFRNGHIGNMNGNNYDNLYWTAEAANWENKWLDYTIIVNEGQLISVVSGDAVTGGTQIYKTNITSDNAAQIVFGASDTRIMLDDIEVSNILSTTIQGNDQVHNWRNWIKKSELGNSYTVKMLTKMSYPEGSEGWHGVSIILGTNQSQEGLSVDLRNSFKGVRLNDSIADYNYTGYNTSVWTPLEFTLDDNKLSATIEGNSYSITDNTIKAALLTRKDIEFACFNCLFEFDAFVATEVGNIYFNDFEPIVSAGNTTYYVNAAAADGGDGLTTATAWNNIDSINEVTFAAGDKILFKRGASYIGILAPKGSGTAENPIIMGAYGKGNRPIIDAATPISEKNGFSTVTLANSSYWTLENLQIQNSNPANPGVPETAVLDDEGNGNLPMRGGLTVLAGYNEGITESVVSGIVIKNCTFTCVDGSGGDEGNSYKHNTGKLLNCGGGCIGGQATSSSDGLYHGYIDGLTVENCTFYNFAGTAVNTAFSGDKFNKNVVVRNNIFTCDTDYTASNHAVYICHAESPIIEYNVVKNLTCGMAYQVCDNGIMRYNRVLNMDGYQHAASAANGSALHWDGCAFDVDGDCTGTFSIYGNVTQNCYSGAFSYFSADTSEQPRGNCDIYIQNNYSFNDNEIIATWAHTYDYNTYVSNNTFVRDADSAYNSSNIIKLQVGSTPSVPSVLHLSNNIFYYPGQTISLSSAYKDFTNNAYVGTFTGGISDVTNNMYDLSFNLPTEAALDNMSVFGTVRGTESFAATDYLRLIDGSDCYNNGAPEVGAAVTAVTPDTQDYISYLAEKAAACVAGDYDNDGACNSDDLVKMRKLLLDIDESESSNADLNGDSKADIRDYVYLKKACAATV